MNEPNFYDDADFQYCPFIHPLDLDDDDKEFGPLNEDEFQPDQYNEPYR